MANRTSETWLINVLELLQKPLPLTPLTNRLPLVLTPMDQLTRTIFPIDIDTELYTESMDIEYTGVEP